ncbi:MAG: HAMP domain-containing sensor histidine kinase [Opitutaceae bacterium]
MLERLRQSLAFRLAVQYALVFALGAGALFVGLYVLLADAFDAREKDLLERQATAIAAAYELNGNSALSALPDSSVFVRLIGPDGTAVFVKVPPGWVETEVKQLPVPGWTQQIHTVRVPQNAARDYTIASSPLPDGWLLQVGRLLDSRAVLLAPLRRAFAGVGAVALLLSVAIGTLLAWRATRPLRAVSDTARRILETGDLSARVPGPVGRGELAVLVLQLNTLLEKNSTHVRVLRDTLDNLAHDLRTPITRLRGAAELALQDAGGDPAEARAALADCINESDRLLHLLETLLDISAAEGGALKLNRDHLDLRMLTERAVDLYREVAEEKNIALILDQPEPVDVDADAIRLSQAINNLLDNALKYTPPGGQVSLTARTDSGTAVLTVTDNGPGIPTEEREAIFRRLYRGDGSRSQRGFGLGLSLVRAIVESHGGTVTTDAAPTGGARFTLRLPMTPKQI